MTMAAVAGSAGLVDMAAFAGFLVLIKLSTRPQSQVFWQKQGRRTPSTLEDCMREKKNGCYDVN